MDYMLLMTTFNGFMSALDKFSEYFVVQIHLLKWGIN